MTKPTTTLVGILNVTPDSFSDGGQFLDPAKALAQIDTMLHEGAGVIDIGAESTRPGATPLNHAEEWERLEPILRTLAQKKPDALLSLDTRHAATAERAIRLGVIDWINDVSACADPGMIPLLQAHPYLHLVIMHNLGIPADKDVTLPEDTDVVGAILHWAEEKIRSLTQQGIPPSRIIFDPGIGFGKTAEQSLTIIRHISRFHAPGVPLLVGHSRKSFLRLLIDKGEAKDRDEATLMLSTALQKEGVQYLRVHDIAGNKGVLQN